MATSRSAVAAGDVIVADDHVDMAELIADRLAAEGWRARVVDSGRAALDAIAERSPDLVITDLRMPGVDGFEVLEAARRDAAVIVMSAFGDIPSAVEVMRRGAFRFVEKPVRLSELVQHARAVLDRRASFGPLVGDSAAMREVAAAANRVARASAPVLLRGESGTGKEVVARAIHAASARAHRPLVAVNCAAIPDALVESELFGHARGAFTGAVAGHAGVFGAADGGTLFLDEIGDMPLAVQAKLLRALQDGEVRAVGADRTRRVDVRVIAATHRPLEDDVRAGRFRADLFYRLSVVPIAIPPLRERRDDIPALARHFLAAARARDPDCRVEELGEDLIAALAAQPWPGNVRELQHVIDRVAILGTSRCATAADLRELVTMKPEFAMPGELVTLRELERQYIAWVLDRTGSKARAAAILGVDPSTLYRRTRGS